MPGAVAAQQVGVPESPRVAINVATFTNAARQPGRRGWEGPALPVRRARLVVPDRISGHPRDTTWPGPMAPRPSGLTRRVAQPEERALLEPRRGWRVRRPGQSIF